MFRLLLSICIVTGLQASIGSEVSYSRACAAGQCGDWKQAQQEMSALIIDDPDRPELVYDNGVAAFRLQEFEKARAYFSTVVTNADASSSLKKQSHFNLGNTQVALNQLPEAIKAYEAALQIDPDDERAKHNLQKVAELLAQQKEEQQQQENQDGDQNHNQGEQGEQDQSGDSSKKQQSGQEGDSQQAEGDQEKGNKQQGEQSHDQSSEQKEKGESDSNQQGDQEDQADSKSAGEDQDQEQDKFGDGHDNSPEGDQDEETSDAHNVASEQQKKQDQEEEENAAIMQADDAELDKDRREQDQKQLQKKFAPNEQWMARLLQRSDKADEHANKQLIKATVDKNMAGKYGQNNW